MERKRRQGKKERKGKRKKERKCVFFPCETISSLIVKGSSDDDGDLCVKRISLKLVFTLKLLCVCLGHCDLKDYHFDYLVSGLLVSSTTINPWVIVTLYG